MLVVVFFLRKIPSSMGDWPFWRLKWFASGILFFFLTSMVERRARNHHKEVFKRDGYDSLGVMSLPAPICC